MGWTGIHATHYKGGTIDRKAECDAYFMESLNAGHYRVEKSTMVGSVYYAAVTALKKYVAENTYEDLPEEKQFTFGVVFLTTVENSDYYNFCYKDLDEDCGPGYFDCLRAYSSSCRQPTMSTPIIGEVGAESIKRGVNF